MPFLFGVTVAIGFKDFLPPGYQHLRVYDRGKNKKIEVNTELIEYFYSVSPKETAIVFYEANQMRIVVTPYSFEQIFIIFSEGKVE